VGFQQRSGHDIRVVFLYETTAAPATFTLHELGVNFICCKHQRTIIPRSN
jgi:hypothetical protein